MGDLEGKATCATKKFVSRPRRHYLHPVTTSKGLINMRDTCVNWKHPTTTFVRHEVQRILELTVFNLVNDVELQLLVYDFQEDVGRGSNS